MGFLKKITKYFAPIIALTYFSLIPLHSSNINNSINPQLKSNQKPLFTLVEKKQKHNVKRGENLWVIAKQYLHNNAANNEIRDKVKEIQKLSDLNPTKENDNIKYVNEKRYTGQDGLVDIIKPEQELTIGSNYEVKYNKPNSEPILTYTKQTNKNKKNKRYFLIPLLGIPFFLTGLFRRKKQPLLDPPIRSKRFSIKRLRNSCLESTLSAMLKQGISYSDVSNFIKEKAYMPISKTTYYRYRNLTKLLVNASI